MKLSGVLLILFGAILLFIGFFVFDPSVPSPSDYQSLAAGIQDRVVTLNGLTRMIAVIVTGGFAFLAGVILLAAGELIERISAPPPPREKVASGPTSLAYEDQF